MPFPTTGVIDNFNRADGALGAAWTAPAISGTNTPVVFTNAVSGAGSADSSACTVASYGPDSEVFFTVIGDGYVETYCCISNPNSGSLNVYYIHWSAGATSIDFARVYGGVDSGSLRNTAHTLTPGQKVGMRVYRSGGDIILEAWEDKGSGWALFDSFTDTGAVAGKPNLAAGGAIGFDMFGSGNASTTRQIEDFGGGTYTLNTLRTAMRISKPRRPGLTVKT